MPRDLGLHKNLHGQGVPPFLKKNKKCREENQTGIYQMCVCFETVMVKSVGTGGNYEVVSLLNNSSSLNIPRANLRTKQFKEKETVETVIR